MTHLQLLPHISFAMVDGRAIFLDLRRDLYVALDGAAPAAFDAFRCSPDGHASEEVAAALLGTGMFVQSHKPCDPLPARIAMPERDLSNDLARPGLKDLAGVLLLVIRSRRAIRKQPLEDVIATRRARMGKWSRTTPSGATLALAQRFLRARALIPIKPVCLQDSLALYDWLAVHGARSSLVLGVQLQPFAAHCWVQLGETVLNDACDRVATYTPILVVE